MVNKLAEAELVVGPINNWFVFFFLSVFWSRTDFVKPTSSAFAFIDKKKKLL